MHYLGVEYESGDEFDSSWSRGQSINFPLNRLIAGWQEGIPGMKVGGRRKLVVPPHQAYGPAGGGHQLSGKTLIFVIDLLGRQLSSSLLGGAGPGPPRVGAGPVSCGVFRSGLSRAGQFRSGLSRAGQCHSIGALRGADAAASVTARPM